MKNKLKRTKNKTMTEQVYEKLEDLIVFCEIEPGTVLTEAEISEMVGAGRTPVREALRLLANESLVNISRIGVLIPEMSGSTQLQLLEVRRAILQLCVKSAINRLTELDKKAIQELLDSVYEQDDVEFLYWLKQRHKVLCKCSKNQFIYEELRNVQGLSHRFWYFYAKKDDHQQGKTLHKNILEAVLSQDLEAAALHVDNLMDYLEEFVRSHSI
ncbi:GntR family transcriptional regulator [Poseidonibacter ostreae]|nr:GntR family transcriptional regulator [Poseidonibacter ostreae]